VAWAKVKVQGKVVGEIQSGLLVFVGCQKGDDLELARSMAEKIGSYRVFPDEEGKTNWDLKQAGGSLLLVPQFTLAADTLKGRRPSFDPTMAPKEARILVKNMGEVLRGAGIQVEEGVFGAEMEVELLNKGPATYLLEKKRAQGGT
jgi:D-tyrosyl-tRNA(Tyr) deacylase